MKLVWVSDITCVPTEEGALYLAGLKELCTGEVVGSAVGDRLIRKLISQSLFMAVRAKRPPPRGLIHDSDRGASTVPMTTGSHSTSLV